MLNNWRWTSLTDRWPWSKVAQSSSKHQVGKMASVGVQADVHDAEGLMGIVASFKKQLHEIQEANNALIASRSYRDASMHTTLKINERVTEQITDLIDNAGRMETLLQLDKDTRNVNSNKLEALVKENDRLCKHLDDDYYLYKTEIDLLTETDVDTEAKLTAHVEDELYRKIEDLSYLHNRLTEAMTEYGQEWDSYKAEERSYQLAKEPLEKDADHLKELRLARCVGAQSGNFSASGYGMTKRMVDYHLSTLTHRQLQEQLNQSREKERDLEIEIGALLKQKRELWKRILDLESCLDECKDDDVATNLLRPTAAYSNLPLVMDGVFPSHAGTAVDGPDDQTSESILQRCHRTEGLTLGTSVDIKEDHDVDTMMYGGAAGPTEQTLPVSPYRLKASRDSLPDADGESEASTSGTATAMATAMASSHPDIIPLLQLSATNHKGRPNSKAAGRDLKPDTWQNTTIECHKAAEARVIRDVIDDGTNVDTMSAMLQNTTIECHKAEAMVIRDVIDDEKDAGKKVDAMSRDPQETTQHPTRLGALVRGVTKRLRHRPASINSHNNNFTSAESGSSTCSVDTPVTSFTKVRTRVSSIGGMATSSSSENNSFETSHRNTSSGSESSCITPSRRNTSSKKHYTFKQRLS